MTRLRCSGSCAYLGEADADAVPHDEAGWNTKET